jgi:uncharacterized protein (DUF885 family)
MVQGLLPVLLLPVVLFSSPLSARGAEEPSIDALAEEYWQAYLQRHPTFATSIGDYRYNDRLYDYSARAEREWSQRVDRLLVDTQRIRPDALSPGQRLNREILERVLIDQQVGVATAKHGNMLDPIYGPHVSFPLILVSQPFRNGDDFAAYVGRLRAFRQQVVDVIAELRGRVREGYISPRLLVERVIPQLRGQVFADARETDFYRTPASAVGVLDAEAREKRLAEIVDALESDVRVAYLALLAYVEEEYLPIARSSVGLSELPRGRDVYAALAALHTTLDTPPEEIHRIGLREVERLRGEMDRVRRRMNFEGPLAEFLDHVRTAPEFRAPSAEALLQRYAATLERAKEQMPRLFGRLPRADCVMKEIEPFRAASAPMAFYNPPPEDASRPAYFYINTYAPNERNLFALEALTYHEAVPGHHLQIALARELTDLPAFRRYTSFTAFIEGWALYAEQLMAEVGAYQDPVQEFGRYNFDIWRACRLVVDTGIHAMGWSRQRAIDFMTANSAFSTLDIENEIDRYITWPGQALAYKLGELKILDLRGGAEQRLGERFDVRAFHDALLEGGALPLDVLERRIEAWIAAQDAAQHRPAPQPLLPTRPTP